MRLFLAEVFVRLGVLLMPEPTRSRFKNILRTGTPEETVPVDEVVISEDEY